MSKSPAEAALAHTDLDHEPTVHLQRLMASWGMLADLCFADLLLFASTGLSPDGVQRFVVLGQVRPTSTRTLHWDDLVGRLTDEKERSLVAEAWHSGEVVDGEANIFGSSEVARVQCIPVRFHRGGDRSSPATELIAVVSREAELTVRRTPGDLERIYASTFSRFASMLTRGEFPFPVEESSQEDAPRVGDGAIVLDRGRRVEYASPNAVNALHRLGIHTNPEGMRLDELGADETAVAGAFATGMPVTADLASGTIGADNPRFVPAKQRDVTVLARCLPLLEQGKVTGALVLMRDITDLRRRDRLLLDKDTTIREIHHRVKNNLQTISSLLRIQSRRLTTAEARGALEEADRRIRSIALVHEILSRDVTEVVPFGEILHWIVKSAEESAPHGPITFEIIGEAGDVPADVATPMAVVLTELVQNAVEHAFPEEDTENARVEIVLKNEGGSLALEVRDNGVGLPDNFSTHTMASMGISIIRHLVTTQLGGVLRYRNNDDAGAIVELLVPLVPDQG